MDNYLSFKAISNSVSGSVGKRFATESILATQITGEYEELPELEYSFDKQSWYVFNLANGIINVPINSQVYFRGDNDSFSTVDCIISFVNRSGFFEVSGNVMSLLDKSLESVTIPNSYCFAYLFKGMGKRTSFGDIELPATKLTDYCYLGMFLDTGIKLAPSLPAGLTEIDAEESTYDGVKVGCYKEMFKGCVVLTGFRDTTFTRLPCRFLKEGCYKEMFRGCIKLTTPLDIKSSYNQVLATRCFEAMYYNCSSLTRAAVINDVKITFYHCCSNMYSGCVNMTGDVYIGFEQSSIKCYRNHYKEINEEKEKEELINYYFPCESNGDTIYDSTYPTWKEQYETCKNNPDLWKYEGTVYSEDEVIIDGPNAIIWNDGMFKNCSKMGKIELKSINIRKSVPWMSGTTRRSKGVFVNSELTEETVDAFAQKAAIPVGQGRGTIESNWTFSKS